MVMKNKMAEEKKKVLQRVHEIVLDASFGMRVGDERIMGFGYVNNVPVGSYAVQVDEPTGKWLPKGDREMKQFVFEVSNVRAVGHIALVKRVA